MQLTQKLRKISALLNLLAAKLDLKFNHTSQAPTTRWRRLGERRPEQPCTLRNACHLLWPWGREVGINGSRLRFLSGLVMIGMIALIDLPNLLSVQLDENAGASGAAGN